MLQSPIMQPPTDGREGSSLSNWQLTRRLVAFAWQFRTDCVLVIVLQLVLLVLGLAGLSFVGLGIDVLYHEVNPAARAPHWPFGWEPPEGTSALDQVLILAVAIVAFAVVRAGLTYAYSMAAARLTQARIVPELRERVYAKLQRLSFRFYDMHASGSIFNRVTSDVQSTRLFVDGVVIQSLIMALSLAVYLVFMVRIHVGLTLACLATTPLLWFVSSYYSQKLRPAYRRNRDLMDRLVLDFSENVRGMQTVKAFAAERQQAQRFEDRNAAVSGQQQAIFNDLSVFTPGTHLLTQLNLVILVAYGGYLYIQEEVALGTGLLVFAGVLQQFSGQIANIAGVANSVQQSLTAARRVFEVLDAPLEVANPANPVRPARIEGRVAFENVTFAYGNGEPVLRGITFETRPGEVLGIFGPTGSGKSTLLSLVPRFFDPQSGIVRVDGMDARTLDLDELRRRIGVVYQESFLFSNTIAANIAFGNPRATQEQIERAARAASAHGFITALPKGYETVLGEAGADLSGGQRQRLALARAILLEPPLLLLDDPTASIDPKTEHEIVDALTLAMRGRTAFIVANRLSLLRRADRIVVLDKGRVADIGTHEELVRRPGSYRDTALLQMMDLGGGRDAA